MVKYVNMLLHVVSQSTNIFQRVCLLGFTEILDADFQKGYFLGYFGIMLPIFFHCLIIFSYF